MNPKEADKKLDALLNTVTTKPPREELVAEILANTQGLSQRRSWLSYVEEYVDRFFTSQMAPAVGFACALVIGVGIGFANPSIAIDDGAYLDTVFEEEISLEEFV